MIRRIGVLCLLLLCISITVCNAYSSGVTENRKKDLEHNSYRHRYYVTVDFSHLYTQHNISCTFTKEFRIDNFEESIGKYIRIIMRKTSMTQTLYYPRRIEFSAEGVHYLSLISFSYERKQGEVAENSTDATFFIFAKDFPLLQKLFAREDVNINMRVYDVNNNYYDYIFDIEQMNDIRSVLFA